MAARFGRSHRDRRTKEVAAAAAIEMEPHVPPPLPVRRGATRKDEDAILIHSSEPDGQPAVGRESAM
jgi:hypothetical protein